METENLTSSEDVKAVHVQISVITWSHELLNAEQENEVVWLGPYKTQNKLRYWVNPQPVNQVLLELQ